jgi:hypothetical protein
VHRGAWRRPSRGGRSGRGASVAPSLPITTALRVICPRCQQEGKPSLLVTIDIQGDDREVHGLCWTHRLRLLAKTTDAPAPREPGKR